ncbi:porin family protein [Sphingobacterium sp. MYb382]|uniref:porin family protein n=1 Tax=Sphingobacterium sp. MYb382 TaxID=2745278 RepID=UPI00309CA62A
MRKTLLAISVALLTVSAAQAQTHWGIKSGLNLGKFTVLEDAKFHTSFHVTGFADIALSEQFSFQPGLSLQGKGTRYKKIIGKKQNYYQLSRHVLSIELPVNMIYYISAGSGKVYVGGGPYVGMNVGGRKKLIEKMGNVTIETKESLTFTGDDRDLNLFDAGANFVLGYKLANGIMINSGYNLGLVNLVPNADKTISNRVLSFGIGFQF